ncbi:hypothetical protein L1280_001002 [Deinococcus sp. HSC-46F16]|uniref:hypothetical protein n=1 Tax=Deinococcus sp. HSC-46F16 TaxID=2910968 RepID=UPI0020A05EC2|nr:hypothetical protein [Deinococcus sp. HSC-46F16]MCP2013874.1 hypothetical protein [Deinococcus sp. HSC-46F16]
MTQQTVWAELVELYEYRVADVRAGGRPRGGLRALGELRTRLQAAPLDPGLSRRLRAADRLYRAYRAGGDVPAEPTPPAGAPAPRAVGTPDEAAPADPAELRAWAELRGLRWERELRTGLEALGREWLAQRGQPGLRVLHAAAESAERAARGQSGGVAVPAAGDPLAALDRPTVARDLLHGVAALLGTPSGWARLRSALLALEAEPLPRHADADVLAAHLRAAEREPLAPAARGELVRALREAHPAGQGTHERPLLREAAAEVRRRLGALLEGAPSPGLIPGAALPRNSVLYAATPHAALTTPPPDGDCLTLHLGGGREAHWRGLALRWERVGSGWQLLLEGPGGREVALLHPGRPAAERVQTLALGPLLPEDAALRLSLSGAHLTLDWLTPPGPDLTGLAAQARIVAALLRPEEGYAGLRLARAVAGVLRGVPVDLDALGPHSAARYAAAPPGALLTLARKGAAALHARAARLSSAELDAVLEQARARLDLGEEAAPRLRGAVLVAREGLPRAAQPVAGGEATLPGNGTFTRLRLPRDPHLLLRAAGTELEVRPGLGTLTVQPPGDAEQELADLLVLNVPGAQVLLVRALEDLGGAVLAE